MFAQLHLSMHEEAERQREPRPSKLLVTAHGGGGAGERPTELVAMWAESATGRCMKVFLAGRKTWRGTVGGGQDQAGAQSGSLRPAGMETPSAGGAVSPTSHAPGRGHMTSLCCSKPISCELVSSRPDHTGRPGGGIQHTQASSRRC